MAGYWQQKWAAETDPKKKAQLAAKFGFKEPAAPAVSPAPVSLPTPAPARPSPMLPGVPPSPDNPVVGYTIPPPSTVYPVRPPAPTPGRMPTPAMQQLGPSLGMNPQPQPIQIPKVPNPGMPNWGQAVGQILPELLGPIAPAPKMKYWEAKKAAKAKKNTTPKKTVGDAIGQALGARYQIPKVR